MATKIIAEAGVNHNGSIDLALKLIEAAKFSGADSIKFQTFKSESLSDFSAPLANYQKSSKSFNTQIDMLKSLELSDEETKTIVKACKDIGIEFMSSPFGIEELNFLLELGMKTIKIPSGEITNLTLLEEIKKVSKLSNLKILMSTGMCNIGDIENALSILDFKNIKERITILHCVSSYPAPNNELNLYALKTIKNCFKCKIGYSDHSQSIIAPIIAIALGSCVIEKHLTLDNDLPGPDHKASITPKVFKELVDNIRESESMLGDGIKLPQNSELETKFVARRSIRASKDIDIGSKITRKDIFFKRPGDGFSPMDLEKVIGSKASKNYKNGDIISDVFLNEI